VSVKNFLKNMSVLFEDTDEKRVERHKDLFQQAMSAMLQLGALCQFVETLHETTQGKRGYACPRIPCWILSKTPDQARLLPTNTPTLVCPGHLAKLPDGTANPFINDYEVFDEGVYRITLYEAFKKAAEEL